MTHAFTRLFVALSAASALAVYACSGPNDPPRVLDTGMSTAAGAGAVAGGSASGGAGGSAGAAVSYAPLCSDVPKTAAGFAPTKGGSCTASDPQLCYKNCGPLSVGFKSETCTSGTYVEQTGCSFPPNDYSCYKVPAAIDPSCPSTTPQASQACDVAPCTPCNLGGSYFDSSGNSKLGYCVCPPAGDSGVRKWSCASATAWPCPLGQGCS